MGRYLLRVCILLFFTVPGVYAGESKPADNHPPKENPVGGSGKEAGLGGTSDFIVQGNALFAKGKFAEAYEQYMAAFLQKPTNIRINFLLGRAAFEMRDFESAVMAYERILSIKPNLPRVKLELARSYAHMGTIDLAKRQFKEVLADNPPESVRVNVERYMKQMKQGFNEQGQPRSAKSTAKSGNTFTGSLSLGLQRDTNIRVSPGSSTVTTVIGDVVLDPAFSKQADWVYTSTLVLNHKYKFKDNHLAWKTTGVSYNAYYDTESDLDLNMTGISTGPAIEYENMILEVRGNFNYLEQNAKTYVRTTGLSAQGTFVFTKNILGYVGLRKDRKKFFQIPDKDATNISVFAGPIFLWGKENANRFTGRLAMESEKAQINTESYTKFTISGRYDRKLPKGFNAYFGYRFQNVNYEELQPLFNRARHDNIHEFTFGLGRRFWQSASKKQAISADLNHIFTKSYSNTELFLYNRNLTTFSLSYSF